MKKQKRWSHYRAYLGSHHGSGEASPDESHHGSAQAPPDGSYLGSSQASPRSHHKSHHRPYYSISLVVAVVFVMLAAVPVLAQMKPYHFGFKRSVQGQLPSIAQEGFQPLLEKYDAIFLGDTSQKELYLTFDNGYENGYTVQILDVLKEKGVPAAFFVTGHYVKEQADLLRRMAAEGHLIGNHSWTHPDMSQISAEQIKQELERVKEEVAAITGQLAMQYLRAPRGIFNEQSLAVSRELGYTNVFWSIAYKDWDTKQQRGAQYAFDSVVKQLHPGAVILLHSVSKDNAEALGRIIDAAREQGYEFKHLNQLTQRKYQ